MNYKNLFTTRVLACIIIFCAVTLRLMLILLGWPLLNSDEGTMGLMGIHILTHREHPIFFYGQNYMGSLEAYIAACFFRLLGVSTVTLRLGLIIMVGGFYIIMYQLTKRLYTPKFALFILVILSLGSKYIFSRELTAVGGAVETLFFGSLLFFLSFIIATESSSNWIFFLWGLVAGLGIWSHMLIIPFIFFSGIIIAISNFKQVISHKSVLLLIGLIIGSASLINYNLHTAPGQNSLAVLQQLHQESGFPHPPLREFLPLQTKGATFITLPIITSGFPLCTTEDGIPNRLNLLASANCILSQILWPLGAILLWIIALIHIKIFTRSQKYLSSKIFLQKITQLCLLLTAGTTFLLYTLSPAAAMYPVTTSRYLIGLVVSTPALLWPIWNLKHPCLRLCLLFLISGVFLLGTIDIFLSVPGIQSQNKMQLQIINTLKQNKIHHIYSEYWTCNRLIFQSQEQIICSVVNESLQPGQNRYPAYQKIVASDRHSAYVFPDAYLPVNNNTDQLLMQEGYKKIQANGFIVYAMK